MKTNKPEVKRFHVDCNGLRAGGSPRDECDVLVVLAKDYERLQAECENLRKDAEMGRVVWKFIDRMNDVCPESDPADKILADFVIAFNAAMQEQQP